MTLTLIRHAPVLSDKTTRLYASELEAWLEKYDRAPIDTTYPDASVVEIIEGADWIVASTMQRSQDSLKLLGKESDEVNELFNESSVPRSDGRFLRLRPNHWLYYYFFLLFIDTIKGGDKVRRLFERAEQAADRLVELSERYPHVALMGHGGANYLIGKVLKKRGWKQTRKGGFENWSYSQFVR